MIKTNKKYRKFKYVKRMGLRWKSARRIDVFHPSNINSADCNGETRQK